MDMKNLYLVFLGGVLSLCSITAYADDSGAEKRIIVGYVENVEIEDIETKIKAKLDTGAQTSSIHANIIEQNEEDVIFEIVSDDEDVENKNIKKPIERFVRIKKKRNDGFIRRPVVKMTFCIAGQRVTEEVNLAERDGFNYDLLIGRNMLEEGKLIVDVSKTFTSKPNCMPAE